MDKSSATILERLYTVDQVAEMWHLSRDKIIARLENEPGVVVFGSSENTKTTRRYRVLRIPASVLHRVIGRLSVRR
jgi:hypothetical protein